MIRDFWAHIAIGVNLSCSGEILVGFVTNNDFINLMPKNSNGSIKKSNATDQ